MCGANSYCRETPGGGQCECKAGFKMNKYKKCVDIDECKLGTHDCGDLGDAYCAGTFLSRYNNDSSLMSKLQSSY